MFIQIIFSLLFGILLGTFTGLIPGIHINLIGAFLITFSTAFFIEPTYRITFISAMAITHTFIDFIPSVFLGCPDTDTELAVLPGYQLLKNRQGYEAIHLANTGSLIAIPIVLILVIPAIYILENLYTTIEKTIPYLLILILILIVFTEKRKGKAIIILMLTGLLGLSINQLENLKQPLLPLLTGLFGASNIILSLRNKTKIPKQIITKPFISLKRPILSSILTAPLCSFLPGMGSGQAAIIGNLIKKNSKKQFLIMTGMINTIVMGFSFISLYSIDKTRTGTALAIKEIIPILETKHLILILATIVISGTISYFLTEFLAKFFALKIKNINYKILSISTLVILVLITFFISGFEGLLILIISTLTGIYSITSQVKRTNMMGCLIIPTIIWYLF